MLLLVHVISLLVHTRRLLNDRIYLKLALFCSSVYIFQTRLVIVKQKVKLRYLKTLRYWNSRDRKSLSWDPDRIWKRIFFSVLAFRLQDNGVSSRTPKTKFLTFFIVLVWMDENGGFKCDDAICHTALVQRLPWMGSYFVRLSVFVSFGQENTINRIRYAWMRNGDKFAVYKNIRICKEEARNVV